MNEYAQADISAASDLKRRQSYRLPSFDPADRTGFSAVWYSSCALPTARISDFILAGLVHRAVFAFRIPHAR